MQSVLICSRLLTRALISGVYNCSSSTEAAVNRKKERDFRLLAVACGFPKVPSRFSALLSRGRYGDDASFFARYKTADVLGTINYLIGGTYIFKSYFTEIFWLFFQNIRKSINF